MRRWRALPFSVRWAVALQALLALPYLAAVLLTPPGFRFGGLIYNPDDPYVYLSWMRQACEGHFFFRNLFTLEPQQGASIHVLFLGLGLLARISGASLVFVYQIARGALGIGFVVVLGALIARVEARPARRAGALVVATLGSGLGWTYFLIGSPLLDRSPLDHVSTDVWMTETVPYLSLLLNPLFVAALTLLLGAFVCSLRAEAEGSLRWAIASGLCLFLLGNIHSYDILLFHPVWIAFLAALGIRTANVEEVWPGWKWRTAWKRYALTAMISAPSVGYQAWVFRSDPAFHARAMVPTLSPPIFYYLLGVGLLLPLACIAGWRDRRSPAVWLLWVWGILGFLLPYVPLAFQRKLAIGLDVPFLILAGMEIAGQAERFSRRRRDLGLLILVGSTLVLFLTNGCFLESDVQMLDRNQSNVFPMLYIPQSDWRGAQWLATHHQPGDTVLSLPIMGNVIPAVSGDCVYVGHWGETDRFIGKLAMARQFFHGDLAPQTARRFLVDKGIKYVFEGAAETDAASSAGSPSLSQSIPGLRRVYGSGPNLSIYAVDPVSMADAGR